MNNLTPREPSEELNQGNEGSTSGQKRRRLVCELILDFAKNSTLHGLRYFTARGLTALEKIFWIIIFLISVVLCVWAMSKVWVKWQTSPIIISVDDQLMSASEVPFPAVTVCPQAKVNQESFNYTKHWITFKKFINRLKKENVTSKEDVQKRLTKFMEETPFMDELVNVNHICNVYRTYDGQLAPYARAHTLAQNIVQAAPNAKDIIWYGQWRNSYIEESDTSQIAPVVTQEGVCFTFNSLATEEIFHMDQIQRNYSYLNATAPRKGWSLEHGYFNRTGQDVYPRRGQASGYSHDLKLFLSEVTHRDFLCDTFDQGFKVYLHHPADLPQISLYHYAAQAQEAASFAIKINVVTTSDALIKYPPHIRQCYFPSEKSLRYFRAYTPTNCRLECLTNHTLARCDCVIFHMPRNDSTALCTSLDQRACFFVLFKALWYSFTYLQDVTRPQSAADRIHSTEQRCYILREKRNSYRITACSSAKVLSNFSETQTHGGEYSANEDGFGNLCYCLPSCYSVQYEAEVTKNYFEATSLAVAHLRAVDEVNNVSKPHTIHSFKDTHLEMYFKEARFATMRRSELFGSTDFLANCGGLLGLFLGFSFLSVVELVYFCTLRLLCMFRRENERDDKKKADHVKVI